VRIVLRFGDEFGAATLSDTPAAREFAAMLPLQLKLDDPMGQAKSGPLLRPIDAAGGAPVFDPAAGEIYYSAPAARSRSSTTTLANPFLIRAWSGLAPWTPGRTESPRRATA
jgi:hypothetical protein